MSKFDHSPPAARFLSAQEFLDYYPDSSGSTVPFEADMSTGNATMDEGYQTASATTMPAPSESRVSAAVTRLGEEDGNHLRVVSDGPPKMSIQDEISSRTASPEPGLEILGRGMREMVEVINRLRQVGVEDFVLPLPKIAGKDACRLQLESSHD